MDLSLYNYSLLVSIPLMLFFGFHMLLGRTPEKDIFSNFLLSRRMMGTALLILSANYCVHLFYGIRLKDTNATILMNLSTYFICYWLFSAAMRTLLDSRYVTRRRFARHIAMWTAFSATAGTVLLSDWDKEMEKAGLSILALWLVGYGLFLAMRLLKTYTKAVKMFEDTHSDDIESYIQWLSVFTYWAVGYGLSCGLLTFLPNRYIFLWVLSSIPFYIYLYCCYQNYILFYERVEEALQEDLAISETEATKEEEDRLYNDNETPPYYAEIESHMEEWIESGGYLKAGITINSLSAELKTNRSYLSEYINTIYGKSFRNWIADLRIEHAKRIMKENPYLKIQVIAESSGFLSINHFTKTFSDREGCTPGKWKRTAM